MLHAAIFVMLALSHSDAGWLDLATKTDVDCVVSVWGSWSKPGKDIYGTGVLYVQRERYVVHEPKGNGNPCPELIQIEKKDDVDNDRVIDEIVKTWKPRDLLVLLDSSGSIRDGDFNEALRDLSRLIQHLCPGPGDIGHGINQYQVALVVFSEHCNQEFGFGQSTSRQDVQTLFSNVKRKFSGLTYTASALKAAREEFLTSPDVRNKDISDKTILVITDGKHNGPLDLKEESQKLAAMGVQVFAMGIGNNIVTNELKMITNYHEEHVFHYSNWRNFHEMVDKVEKAVIKWSQVDCVFHRRKF